MKRFFDWIDAGSPARDRASFRPRRAARLFLAILGTSVLAALPLGLLKIGIVSAKQGQRDRRMQQRHERVSDMEKAAREGKAGEATRRLLGIADEASHR
jgi:hypothetical protein